MVISEHSSPLENNPFAEEEDIKSDPHKYSYPTQTSNPFVNETSQQFSGNNEVRHSPVSVELRETRLMEELPWEQKATEIEARTRELQKREAELNSNNNNNQNKTFPPNTVMTQSNKNWPFFYPLVFHDIEAELPSTVQTLAKRMTAVAYFINVVAMIVMLFSGVSGYSSLTGTIVAALYLVLFPAAAFFSWHVGLYKALKFDSSFWFITYFVSFGIQMLFYCFMGVGLFNGGAGGVLGMLEMLTHGKIIATILAGLCTCTLGVCIFLGIGLMKQVNDQFRSGGHSMQRAGAEAGRAAARNDTVRQTTKETIINAV